jgi:hypothetical protein
VGFLGLRNCLVPRALLTQPQLAGPGASLDATECSTQTPQRPRSRTACLPRLLLSRHWHQGGVSQRPHGATVALEDYCRTQDRRLSAAGSKHGRIGKHHSLIRLGAKGLPYAWQLLRRNDWTCAPTAGGRRSPVTQLLSLQNQVHRLDPAAAAQAADVGTGPGSPSILVATIPADL